MLALPTSPSKFLYTKDFEAPNFEKVGQADGCKLTNIFAGFESDRLWGLASGLQF